MDKTLVEQFEEFINEFHRNLFNDNWNEFEKFFIFSLFIESKKRRMNEGCEGLAMDAALSMLETFREGFEKNKREFGTPFYCHNQSYKIVACEIADQLPQRVIVKLGIEKALYEFRKQLFDEPLYKQYLCEVVIEEHPMQTFVRWMDYIENLKSNAEYPNWIWLKRNIVNLMRVGNAIFHRSEWQNKVTKMEVGL